jgi:hypothetical protein
VVMTNSQNGTTDQANNSWQNEYLKQALQKGAVNVTFVKKDGTERKMECTLKPDLLPAQTDVEEQIQQKQPKTGILAVWDLEKGAWRSFRYDSILGFSENSNGIN